MAVWHEHLVAGQTDHGIWMTGITTFNASGDLPGAHTAWINAISALLNGSGPGITGVSAWISPLITVDRAITYTVSDVDGKKQARAETALNIVGTGNTVTGVPQASIVINWTIAGRSDAGKVRMWLPPFTFDAAEGGIPTHDALVAVQDGALAFLQSLKASGYPAQWVRRAAHELVPISGFIVFNKFSSIESRGYPPTVGNGNPDHLEGSLL